MITKRIGNCTVRLDMTVLESMKEKLRKANGARAEVGLFAHLAGRTNKRGQKNLNNPTLGMYHEFGYEPRNLPARSFLRMPLMTRLFPAVRSTDWIGLIMSKGVPHALALLGVKAELVIHKAFDTEGWGFWKRLRPATIMRKGHDQILLESGQLRRAISSRVVIP